MQQYNNIVSEYSEYFFENFKGGGKGGGKGGMRRKKRNKDERDKAKNNITTIGILLAIIAFLYSINKMYPKETNATFKKYEIYDEMNYFLYIIFAFIIIVILYYIYIYFDTPIENDNYTE